MTVKLKALSTKNYFIDAKNFKKYLDGLNNQNLPFKCPFLRVLPEEIAYSSIQYEKDTLICKGKLDSPHIGAACGLEGDIILNKEGDLEVYCDCNDNKFTFIVESFKLRRK